MLESQIQSKILRYLEGRDDVLAIRVMRASRAGTPDIVAVWNDGTRGLFVAIEVKRPEGKTSAIQKYFHGRIRALNGLAIVATCVETVARVLGRQIKEQSMTCKVCGKKKRGRPHASGICAECRKAAEEKPQKGKS